MDRVAYRREKRPCRDCGKLCSGTRCRDCHRLSLPPAAPARVKTWREKQRRARFVASWRANVGDWCPGYQRPGHHVDPERNPLTADHVQAVAAGGREDGELSILCRSCNASKRDGRDRRTVRRTPPPAGQHRHSRDWDAEQPIEIRSRSW